MLLVSLTYSSSLTMLKNAQIALIKGQQDQRFRNDFMTCMDDGKPIYDN